MNASIDAEEIRALLEDERARLQQIRASLAMEPVDPEAEDRALGELSSTDQHVADLASETFERERDQSILAHVDEKLADVDRAMEQLENGTYGRCEVCGRPIDADRLLARPAARRCLEDQEKAERGSA
jgi:RNA polymerase-binding transcription factor DksA